ncbi:uncharacterized protein LOC131692106 [Topomyia yanbarensis]|uniref:uncharacterized protein LOC131692106 n=1 Tax=Topomyia yanbarensis TaxID=2498891 RepID=UPI00273BFDE4|nr:uncharacterized protein LOC131692106 [Topomyia yanbarensis]
MVLVRCAFDNCGSKRTKHRKSISFFRFPREARLLKKWLDFFNEHNPTKLDRKTLLANNAKLCHLHFKRDQVLVKSNSDRAIVRDQVPCCPPGVIDQGHAKKALKPKEKTIKNQKTGTQVKQYKLSAVDPITEEKTSESNPPLYHSISGYMVDLRIAAQQETFRLPNGKLIQVRRQPKRSPSESPSKTPPEIQNAESADTIDLTPETESTPATEEALVETQATEEAEVPLALSHAKLLDPAHVTHASKTYTNKRASSQRSPPKGKTRPVPRFANQPRSTSKQITSTLSNESQSAPTSQPCTSPASFTSVPQITRPRSTAQIAPPVLTSLQNLFQKQHENSTFGNFQKQFENQLISAAEISLHVVSKVNNLLNSNPFKNAANERDLKELYITVSYILKYATDRFNGLEESIANDIKSMGFTDQCDLGPVLESQTREEASKTNAEDNPKAHDDDDCAIIEQRTDLIEILSDEEGDEDLVENEPVSSKKSCTVKPPITAARSRGVRICSDTESVADNVSDNEPEQVSTAGRTDGQASGLELTANEDESDRQTADESDVIELVVKHEIRKTTTNLVESYYFEEEAETEKREDEVVAMDIQDESHSGSENQECEQSEVCEEETEELIEIIEGDVDLDFDDGNEYKVVDIIDGDFYLISHD